MAKTIHIEIQLEGMLALRFRNEEEAELYADLLERTGAKATVTFGDGINFQAKVVTASREA